MLNSAKTFHEDELDVRESLLVVLNPFVAGELGEKICLWQLDHPGIEEDGPD